MLEIKDNKIEVDHKHSDRILKIFKRLHKKKDYSGTGIAFSYKKIIGKHWSGIWVESEPGKSNAIYFTIPQNN